MSTGTNKPRLLYPPSLCINLYNVHYLCHMECAKGLANIEKKVIMRLGTKFHQYWVENDPSLLLRMTVCSLELRTITTVMPHVLLGFPNHRQFDCLMNSLLRLNTSKLEMKSSITNYGITSHFISVAKTSNISQAWSIGVVKMQDVRLNTMWPGVSFTNMV